MSLHVELRGARSAKEEKEVFHGCLDEEGFGDDYFGAGVAGRAIRLDGACGNDAIHAISHGRA